MTEKSQFSSTTKKSCDHKIFKNKKKGFKLLVFITIIYKKMVNVQKKFQKSLNTKKKDNQIGNKNENLEKNDESMAQNGKCPKKNEQRFYACKICDYKSNKKSNYERHLKSIKHIYHFEQKNEQKNDQKKYVCKDCQKSYKYLSGYSRHKKNCIKNVENNEIIQHNDNVQNNVTEELDYKKMFIQIMEQNQKILETTIQIAKEPKIINNTQFNIMNFLNTECKDALNFTDFIEQLKYTYNDLLQLPEEGWQQNVANTFVKQLTNLDLTKRPIERLKFSDTPKKINKSKSNESTSYKAASSVKSTDLNKTRLSKSASLSRNKKLTQVAFHASD